MPKKDNAENPNAEVAILIGVDDIVDNAADREHVERERDDIRKFVDGLTADDLRSGNWFEKLLAHALGTYTKKVDWRYFQEKYRGVPADVIVDQRIRMAGRYAAIEGGLSAGAYTAAVVATLGSLGGASPATVPAALATLMVDVAFTTQLQIRLAYDISVLYRVPVDVDDPDDLWKLIRVAFTIKGGEVVRGGVIKVVPALVRPLIKKFYSGAVLSVAKGLPVIGKFLLQRTAIKVGIPLVGIPLAVLLNRWTTLITGRHARAVFRNDARVIEVAESLSNRTSNPRLLLWVAWLVVKSDKKISDDEALMFRHLVQMVKEKHEVIDDELSRLIELDREDVWRRIESSEGDLADILFAAELVASVDGDVTASERAVIVELRDRIARRKRAESVR